MGKIHLLPDHLIAQIAAGEVIERPAYALKELLDNAIDAKATFIKIEIEKSGLQKIMISDNGEGMTKDDMLESFKLHTTSKITTGDNLVGIKTMGFRGEALASIASISNLSIKSRTSDQPSGTQIELMGGKLDSINPAGMPVGSIISISDLFHTVPVRKKFLKNLAYEFRIILDIVTRYAIAHPEIGFILTHNDKMIFTLPKDQDLSERIKKLLGENIYTNLVPVASSLPYLSINGFISKPQISTKTQHKHLIYINKRSVNNSTIVDAVKDAYGSLLQPRAYPVVILFINLPHEAVDVNIHPRKEKINFHDSALIYESVLNTVSDTLAKYNLTFHDLRWQAKGEKDEMAQQRSEFIREGNTKTFAAELLKDEVAPWKNNKLSKVLESKDVVQMHNLYIVAQTSDGILIIDQHAAHERILYEQFLESFKKMKSNSTQYLLPKTILFDLSIVDAETLLNNIDTFSSLGFDIEQFGGNTFKATAVPQIFKDRNIASLITETIEDLSKDNNAKEVDTQSHKMITYLACRSAIKAGDKLTKEECKDLLEQLSKYEGAYTCPHGRPLKVEFTIKELHKLFHRI